MSESTESLVRELLREVVVKGLLPLGILGFLIWMVFEDRKQDRSQVFSLVDKLIQQQGQLVENIDRRDQRVLSAIVKGLEDLTNRQDRIIEQLRVRDLVLVPRPKNDKADEGRPSINVAPVKRRRR